MAVPYATKYADLYDLFYRDKDYAGEADYVARALWSEAPDARTILELGSGTGQHGRLLASRGFHVHGVERSPDMVGLAKSAAAPPRSDTCGSFSCEVGDACSVYLDRRFDAVIALFHVVCYQTTNDDLEAVFAAAARHLTPGGVFLFDVWHGPAVLAQRPQRRVKKLTDGDLEVTRTARPELDIGRNAVKVTYDVECRSRGTSEIVRFSEDHLVRFLFPEEIEAFARKTGLRLLISEEFISGKPPSEATWGVAYILRK